eukprot:775380-Amphidinium_carterae.1
MGVAPAALSAGGEAGEVSAGLASAPSSGAGLRKAGMTSPPTCSKKGAGAEPFGDRPLFRVHRLRVSQEAVVLQIGVIRVLDVRVKSREPVHRTTPWRCAGTGGGAMACAAV